MSLHPLRQASAAVQPQANQTPTIPAQARESRANASSPATQSAAGNVESTSPVFEEMAKQGYIDEPRWQEFDERIKGMSKAENKLFWQQMTAAIEKGDVAVYMESR